MSASPCRSRHPTRPHACSPQHADIVWGYRDARAADEERCEQVAMGYPSESADYRRDVGMITFRSWLVANRGLAG